MKKITFMMALILIGTMSFAQRAPRAERGEERPNKERSHERMADHLDLTDEQQQQMKDLRLAHLKKTSETQSQMKIKKAELEAAIKSEKSVDQLIDEIGKLENKLLEARIKHRIDMRNVLDDDQKIVFDQMADRQPRRGHHGGKGK